MKRALGQTGPFQVPLKTLKLGRLRLAQRAPRLRLFQPIETLQPLLDLRREHFGHFKQIGLKNLLGTEQPRRFIARLSDDALGCLL